MRHFTSYCLLAFVLLLTQTGFAQSFRYGNIRHFSTAGTSVTFLIDLHLTALPGGLPAVGETVTLPGFPLRFGDGDQEAITVRVGSVDAAGGFFIGRATVLHTYASTGSYVATLTGCCRVPGVENVSGSIFDSNRPAEFRLGTEVVLRGGGMRSISPYYTGPAVVNVPVGNFSSIRTVTVPLTATGPDGGRIRFRAASAPTERPGFWFPTPQISADGVAMLNLFSPQIGQLFVVTGIVENAQADGTVNASSQFDFLLRVTPSEEDCSLAITGVTTTDETCTSAGYDGRIDIVASSGRGALDYTVAGPITVTQRDRGSFDRLPPGDYTITVTTVDDPTCSVDTTVFVNVPSGGIYYADKDGDGFGDDFDVIYDCLIRDGYTITSGDCNDDDSREFPGQNWYIDEDGDGFYEASALTCERPPFGFLESELSTLAFDNCPKVANPDQADANGNGVGDACDPDFMPNAIAFTISPPPTDAGFYVVETYDTLDLNVEATTEEPTTTLSITQAISQDGSPFSGFGRRFTPTLPTPPGNPTATQLRYTPDEFDWGVQAVTFTAAGGQLTADTTVTLLVNTRPRFTRTPVDYYDESFNDPFDNLIIVRDPNLLAGDSLTLIAIQIPSWMTFTDEGDGIGKLSGRTAPAGATTYEIIIEARDKLTGTYPGGAPVRDTFDLNVQFPFECFLQTDAVIIGDESCPGTADGSIEVRISEPNGTALYNLYEYVNQSRVRIASESSNDTSYTFTGLTAQDYYVEVIDLAIGEQCSDRQDVTVGSNASLTFYYRDSDGDGFGDLGVSRLDCSRPTGYVDNGMDCDDSDPDKFPGQVWYVDRDGDGYHEITLEACERPFRGFLRLTELTGPAVDNCPLIANPDQVDNDRDGVGFACDDNDYEASCRLAIDSIVLINERCAGAQDASATVYTSGERGLLEYDLYRAGVRIRNQQDSSTFPALTAGTYEIILSDFNSDEYCQVEQEIVIGADNGSCDTTGTTSYSLEAECAAVGGSWEITLDSEASNGQFVYAPNERHTAAPPADVPANRVRFALESAAAGNYRLHVRAYTPARDSDSFWVRVNGGAWIRWNEIDCNRRLSWAELPNSLALQAGTNTLDIAFREGRTQLDKVYLTQGSEQPADLGQPATNCTQLANQSPIALASASAVRGIAPLEVTLDGSASYDADGTIVDYTWQWASGSAKGATPTVTLISGMYKIELTVTDDLGVSGTTTVTIEVLNPTGTATAPPFAFEAECADRERQWRPYGSSEASGGKFVSYVGCRCTDAPPQQPDRYLHYTFSTGQADTFYLFLRLDAPDPGRNSFWVRVDDGQWLKMWREADGRQLLTSGFEWRRVTDDAREVDFLLPAGQHTITVAPREPGTKLDKLIMTTETALPNGTGAAATNCTTTAPATVAARSFVYDEAAFVAVEESVWPNPTTDLLTLELRDGYTGPLEITVFDGMGRRVRQLQRAKEDTYLRTDLTLEELPPGAYHLRVLRGDCQSIHRFIKL